MEIEDTYKHWLAITGFPQPAAILTLTEYLDQLVKVLVWHVRDKEEEAAIYPHEEMDKS